MVSTRKKVAVLGGGYAGMAAAVALVDAGAAVTVFEAGPVLGGRARRVMIDGRKIDNGQHLLVGGYTELLALMRQVGVDPDIAFLRTALDLRVLPDFHLRCPRLPAPLHLVAALLSVKGLSWPARWALIRAMSSARSWTLKVDVSVADWLRVQRQPPALIESFWRPLTVAALNTPLDIASTQILFNVLRDSLGGMRTASDLLFPKLDFSALLPDAAAVYIEARGGVVKLRNAVSAISRSAQGWQVNGGEFDAVVCALPPHRLAMALAHVAAAQPALNLLADWDYQPIVTLYLQYSAQTALCQPMIGMADGLSQWVFDRNYTHATPGLIAVVLSARGAHSALNQSELTAAVVHELTRHFAWGVPTWARVISEKRATFACTPNLRRPSHATADSTLWLAGDYTASDYPATLEGAVRSGLTAARGIIAAI